MYVILCAVSAQTWPAILYFFVYFDAALVFDNEFMSPINGAVIFFFMGKKSVRRRCTKQNEEGRLPRVMVRAGV